MANLLEQSIYNTIRYFDIFDLPVTATQIWQCLIVGSSGPKQRWAGHRRYGLPEIQSAVGESPWLSERIGSKWGFYFCKGKEALVRRRLRRHVLAQQKWKILTRVARVLAAVPFVQALAGSGSLAWDNTTPQSDLDVFVITKARRIWTARLFLLAASQLLGRRRKYWNRKAPDKACLNHYITDDGLMIPDDVQNLYTAVQYTLFVPLSGLRVLTRFFDENASWMRPYVMAPEFPRAGNVHAVTTPRWAKIIKRGVENILLEPIGDVIERYAERFQRYTIRYHTIPGRAGRIALSDHELAFHPDTKVPAVLSRFDVEPGQKQLL